MDLILDQIAEFQNSHFLFRTFVYILFELFLLWLIWENPDAGQILGFVHIVAFVFFYYKEFAKGSW